MTPHRESISVSFLVLWGLSHMDHMLFKGVCFPHHECCNVTAAGGVTCVEYHCRGKWELSSCCILLDVFLQLGLASCMLCPPWPGHTSPNPDNQALPLPPTLLLARPEGSSTCIQLGFPNERLRAEIMPSCYGTFIDSAKILQPQLCHPLGFGFMLLGSWFCLLHTNAQTYFW